MNFELGSTQTNPSSHQSLTLSNNPQYLTTSSSPTCEGHACALVCENGMVMVFRADTIGEHYLWVRALRARLSPESTVHILDIGK